MVDRKKELSALRQERLDLKQIIQFGVHRPSYHAYLQKCLQEVEEKIKRYERED